MIALFVSLALGSSRDACVERYPHRAPATAQAYFNAFDPIFERVGNERNVAPGLLKAIAWCETRLDPCSVSPVGAQGLMQIVASVCLHQGESTLGSRGRIVRQSCTIAPLTEGQKQEAVPQAKTTTNEVTSWLY